ncbi:LytR C-terminal domain-containing protein [Rhodococcus sp. OK302]|uniref:LytR C-terminal domain-containing protein n=1 Tax=Rhodococcus sp. OK302 TaxID=1882769 RepID=UPI000B93B595|nr:LytR C-terminal domain-containing protein [Rhodococcus sp. OK302]
MSTPKEQPSGPPLRAIAMVLIALAIVFVGLGAASLGGSDSDETTATEQTATSTAAVKTTAAAPVTTAPAAATGTDSEKTTTTRPSATATSTSASASTSIDPSTVNVRVLNNSTVSGLAAGTAEELTAAGWNVQETGNYSEGTVSTTTVFYGTSATEKAAAQQIAAELGVTAEPRFAGIANASPGVIVIVTTN